jgi:hypothetical protein
MLRYARCIGLDANNAGCEPPQPIKLCQLNALAGFFFFRLAWLQMVGNLGLQEVI